MHPDDKAVPLTQDEGNVDGARQARQSHLCCGCCCDTRRAVMVVNVISLCLAGLTVLSRKFNIFVVLGMICPVAAIFGAHKFNKIGVAIGANWYALETIRRIVYFDSSESHDYSDFFFYPVYLDFAVPSILYGFFCYPHAVFLHEMYIGVMTPENYSNEERCCPCSACFC
jgi:hypothetical protein